ncbi:MAG: 16S rRNA (cytidine(1402)-2'-O)-methyltransferase [Patescibacteria group bacterium]
MTKLYVVATPIGNLGDITIRAQEVLKTVPVVLAEDTRRTRTLLSHLGAHPKLVSYHQHTSPAKSKALVRLLEQSDVALVTDAGTPGIADPGGQFVAAVVETYGDSVQVVPLPGASALAAAASIAGCSMDRFVFAGYPPHKKGRATFFDGVATHAMAVIFYESPHRISKALQAVAERQPERQIVVCRELTKQFETIQRSSAREAADRIADGEHRGEFVVVLHPVGKE